MLDIIRPENLQLFVQAGVGVLATAILSALVLAVYLIYKLATNHIPHVQIAVEENTKVMVRMEKAIEHMASRNERLCDTLISMRAEELKSVK